jgi:hypothetical protein
MTEAQKKRWIPLPYIEVGKRWQDHKIQIKPIGRKNMITVQSPWYKLEDRSLLKPQGVFRKDLKVWQKGYKIYVATLVKTPVTLRWANDEPSIQEPVLVVWEYRLPKLDRANEILDLDTLDLERVRVTDPTRFGSKGFNLSFLAMVKRVAAHPMAFLWR